MKISFFSRRKEKLVPAIEENQQLLDCIEERNSAGQESQKNLEHEWAEYKVLKERMDRIGADRENARRIARIEQVLNARIDTLERALSDRNVIVEQVMSYNDYLKNRLDQIEKELESSPPLFNVPFYPNTSAILSGNSGICLCTTADQRDCVSCSLSKD